MRRQGSSRICSSIRLAQPLPTSTNKRQIVSRCVPLIRSVLRIEEPSTKQLMIWTRRANGTRFIKNPSFQDPTVCTMIDISNVVNGNAYVGIPKNGLQDSHERTL